MRKTLAILTILVGICKITFAETGTKLTPSYQTKNDSLSINLEIENIEGAPIVLKFDQNKIVRYRYICSNKEHFNTGYNYDDSPDCTEFRNNVGGYLSKYPEKESKSIILFCSQTDWTRIKIPANSKVKQKLFSVKLPPKCDSIEVSVSVNKGQFEVIDP